MANELVDLIAKRFIQRKDVKAVQFHSRDSDGWTPERTKFTRADLEGHVAGERSLGHYLLDQDSVCKLFAFDIDLEKKGWLPTAAPELALVDGTHAEWVKSFVECNPREIWQDRAHPSRSFIKSQMRVLANKLAAVTHQTLGIPVAITYSGHKGMHVYGFTGPVAAAEAREGAQIVLETVGEFQLTRGKAFYMHSNRDPVEGYPNFSIEVFPKQDSLDGKDLGNLMALPLGKHLRTKFPRFFVNAKAPYSVIEPTDPVAALASGNPWI